MLPLFTYESSFEIEKHKTTPRVGVDLTECSFHHLKYLDTVMHNCIMFMYEFIAIISRDKCCYEISNFLFYVGSHSYRTKISLLSSCLVS